jgi:hypothetical protein
MMRLILTSSSGVGLVKAGRADIVVPFSFRFVWGPLQSESELSSYLAARSPAHGPGEHWSDYAMWGRSSDTTDDEADEDLGLFEFCKHCEAVELWFDPDPNDQLLLIWLLDCLRSHPEIVAKLKMALVDFDLILPKPEHLAGWKGPKVEVAEAEFETASLAWQAYRAATPEACFGLLREDLSKLPSLKPAISDLLDELPSATTGLGATEMRMLELIARGYELTNALFHLRTLRRTRIFSEWEHGYLLDGLAHGPMPAVAGLDDALRTINRENLGARHPAYLRSRLSLTDFGKAVIAHKEDFSRHNPIHRWWGGTELTNERLWRLKPVLMKP